MMDTAACLPGRVISRVLRFVSPLLLAIHALIAGALGVALFAFPVEAGSQWPWTLSPLAARFVGAALLGIAAGVALTSRRPTRRRVIMVGAMGLATMLVSLIAILGPDPELSVSRWLALTVALGSGAIADGVALAMLPGADGRRDASPSAADLPAPLVWFFAVHLVLVAVVGAAMFVFPTEVRGLWPWQLSVVNVRLVGSIFLGSVPVSVLALRFRDRPSVMPAFAAYATFTILALVAAAVHFGLFNPGRIVTWVFIGLYAVTAATAVAGILVVGTAPAPGTGRGGEPTYSASGPER